MLTGPSRSSLHNSRWIPKTELCFWVGTASPGDEDSVDGAEPVGSRKPYDCGTSYCRRSGPIRSPCPTAASRQSARVRRQNSSSAAPTRYRRTHPFDLFLLPAGAHTQACGARDNISLRGWNQSSRVNKVSLRLPSSAQLRFTLAHVVTQGHGPCDRVIEHSL